MKVPIKEIFYFISQAYQGWKDGREDKKRRKAVGLSHKSVQHIQDQIDSATLHGKNAPD
jgi:hypothetical protein